MSSDGCSGGVGVWKKGVRFGNRFGGAAISDEITRYQLIPYIVVRCNEQASSEGKERPNQIGNGDEVDKIYKYNIR
jgi:hypothetical protein